MDPIQTNCHISTTRFSSWMDQALKGHLHVCVSHKWKRAEIFKGSYLVNGLVRQASEDDIKIIFWKLMHKYGRIQVDGHLYLVRNQEQELWDKYMV